MTSLRVVKAREFGVAAADTLLDLPPDAVIGWPTGRTPLPLYAELRRRADLGALDARRWRAVMLDDYLGASGAVPGEPSSYRWLRRELFEPLAIGPERTLRIPTEPAGIEDACDRFERGLGAWGGCGVLFLGLGGNGHIGFNEPGSRFDSCTRVVELSHQTARANAAYWQGRATPRCAVTQGVATILEARRIVLLVCGGEKAVILAAALTGPVTPALPASFLQRAADLVVVADSAAARGLDLREPARIKASPRYPF